MNIDDIIVMLITQKHLTCSQNDEKERLEPKMSECVRLLAIHKFARIMRHHRCSFIEFENKKTVDVAQRKNT